MSTEMKGTVICDLDETLVWSRSTCEFEGCTKFKFEGDDYHYYTVARPGAKEFLKELRDKGIEVISVTQGVVPFQKGVVGHLGLLSYFSSWEGYEPDAGSSFNIEYNIFGWSSNARQGLNKDPKEFLAGKKWVMVDNLHYQDMTLREKMNWIGAEFEPKKNFIQCECFYGPCNPDVQDLRFLIPEIEEMLNA